MNKAATNVGAQTRTKFSESGLCFLAGGAGCAAGAERAGRFDLLREATLQFTASVQ